MNDSNYKNMLRRNANSCLERASAWEKLAKEHKAKGSFAFAIRAARHARHCRQDAARFAEYLNEPMKMGILLKLRKREMPLVASKV